MNSVNFGGMTDYEAEAQQLAERKRYAEALRAQGQQAPQGRMAGRVYVPPNPLEHLANALRQYSGQRELQDVRTAEQGLTQRKQEDLANYLKSMPTATTTTEQQLVGDRPGAGSFEPVSTTKQPTPEDYFNWMAQGTRLGPQAMQLGQMAYQGAVRNQDRADDRSFKTETLKEDRAFREQQAAEARQQRMVEIQLRLQDAQLSREQNAALRREMAGLAAANRPQAAVTPVTVMRDGKPVVIDGRTLEVLGDAPPPKGKEGGSLPPGALKMQQAEIEAINAAGGIIADTSAFIKQIDDKKLQLGPVNNLVSSARNAVGMSSPESENYATFKSTLERLRNESLRLNTGVQTDGDAQRAWAELIDNINDPKVVRRQLERINQINERAVTLRQANIDGIRKNYNMDPLDTSVRQVQAPAIGVTPGKPRRYNPATGALE